MKVAAGNMRLEELQILIVSEDPETKHLQELILSLRDTEIHVFDRCKRHARVLKDSLHTLYSDRLHADSLLKAKKIIKSELKSDVLGLIATASFSRNGIGYTDDGHWMGLDWFEYNGYDDSVNALIRIDATSSSDWEPFDFELSSEDFWSAGLVSSMADHIDDISTELGFPTNVRNKTLKIAALRSV